MAEIIRVDYEALAKIADQFGREAEAIEQMLQKIRGSMAPLQNGGWVGRGSEAFFAEMEGDILPAARRLADALGQASAVSRQVGEMMQGAEEEACSPFRAGESGGAAGPAVGPVGGRLSGRPAGVGPGGNMYVPQDWLSGVSGFARGGGGRAVNDWGIPQNWLDGVAGAMGIGGGGNYGIPQDWLSGVTDALGGSGASGGGAATGGAAGGAGSVGGAGGASGAATEPPEMPSGGMGGGKETAASDIRSPFGRQAAATGSSTLFGGGKVVAEAQNGRLSYQSLGGAGLAPAADGAPAATAVGGSSGAVPAVSDKGGSGIGLVIAALTPLAGIMGKAVKDALDK